MVKYFFLAACFSNPWSNHFFKFHDYLPMLKGLQRGSVRTLSPATYICSIKCKFDYTTTSIINYGHNTRLRKGQLFANIMYHILCDLWICPFKQQSNNSWVSFTLMVWYQYNVATLQSRYIKLPQTKQKERS